MGRTSQPLVIWVDRDWRDHPEIEKLEAQGHTIVQLGGAMDTEDPLERIPDLILSRAAWYWSDVHWGYLDAALKAARARKKAPGSPQDRRSPPDQGVDSKDA